MATYSCAGPKSWSGAAPGGDLIVAGWLGGRQASDGPTLFLCCVVAKHRGGPDPGTPIRLVERPYFTAVGVPGSRTRHPNLRHAASIG